MSPNKGPKGTKHKQSQNQTALNTKVTKLLKNKIKLNVKFLSKLCQKHPSQFKFPFTTCPAVLHHGYKGSALNDYHEDYYEYLRFAFIYK